MPRGPNGNFFWGNINTLGTHYLKNEKPPCQVEEMIAAGNDGYFTPDPLEQA